MTPMERRESPAASVHDTDESLAFDRVRDALRGLRFGAVTIIVQDGIVVQVDRTEKLRLLRSKA